MVDGKNSFHMFSVKTHFVYATQNTLKPSFHYNCDLMNDYDE